MTAHVVIVGAGIIGASIAFHLSHQRDIKVTVLDQSEPGLAASNSSFAWINARDKDPRGYHDLNRRSLDMWPRFERRLGGNIGLTWGGELRWSATSGGARQLETRVRELQSWGYPIRLLSPPEVRSLEPHLRVGEIVNASYSEADGHVDAPEVVRRALALAVQRGAEVRTGTRAGYLSTSGTGASKRVDGVVAVDSLISCDAVVLAAGTGTTELAESAGLVVPQAPTSGATVVTPQLPPVFKTVCAVHTPRDKTLLMNIRQLQDGRVMVHGGDHGQSLGDRSIDDAQMLLRAASSYIPALKEAPVAEVRRAMRPMPVDGHPVLGFARALPNVYVALTHSGVTLAPLIGEMAALEIADGARVDLLEPYRPDRFG